MYYRDAVGAIIVYDITFKESFDRVYMLKYILYKLVLFLSHSKEEIKLTLVLQLKTIS
jgi:GTPase SAR1 family protein